MPRGPPLELPGDRESVRLERPRTLCISSGAFVTVRRFPWELPATVGVDSRASSAFRPGRRGGFRRQRTLEVPAADRAAPAPARHARFPELGLYELPPCARRSTRPLRASADRCSPWPATARRSVAMLVLDDEDGRAGLLRRLSEWLERFGRTGPSGVWVARHRGAVSQPPGLRPDLPSQGLSVRPKPFLSFRSAPRGRSTIVESVALGG